MNAAPHSPSGTNHNDETAKKKDLAVDAKNGVVGDVTTFLLETYQEFRKISWPSRQQVIQETWTVLVLVSVITGAVLGFDYAIAKVVFEPLDKWAKHMGGGVGKERELNSMPPVPLSAPIAPTAPQAPAQPPSSSK